MKISTDRNKGNETFLDVLAANRVTIDPNDSLFGLRVGA